MEIAARAFTTLEGLGARNIRMWNPLFGGTQIDVAISTIEYDSMRALGRTQDQFAATKEGQALIELLASDASPVVNVSSELYQEVAL
jgi:chemotaxis receptor (MCP) glutamine deamidase CheD